MPWCSAVRCKQTQTDLHKGIGTPPNAAIFTVLVPKLRLGLVGGRLVSLTGRPLRGLAASFALFAALILGSLRLGRSGLALRRGATLTGFAFPDVWNVYLPGVGNTLFVVSRLKTSFVVKQNKPAQWLAYWEYPSFLVEIYENAAHSPLGGRYTIYILLFAQSMV